MSFVPPDGPLPGVGPTGPQTTSLVLHSPDGAEVVLCDVSGATPDALTVDVLATLQLLARRRGCRVQLRHASRELLELIDFMGLEEVLL
jgi:ABC-type transporter Mla MlaB component